ncbi:MAG: NADH-quinone oxidoreductase subunit L, partial [Burkholderiales bacterium]|nr:NADH-quinone oxidoreductase subunit L [Burkholderiales bacterium]
AVLAGLVMLTRVSIKVSLAWSTVAQMGFMILECGLGLYSLAALHLFGHSLYKAHRFLAASSVVQDVRQARMAGSANLQPYSLVLAPIVAVAVVVLTLAECHPGAWPWWWSSMLGFAWASFLWMPMQSAFDAWHCAKLLAVGIVTIAGLTGAALLGHLLPLDIQDHPNAGLGMVALFGMALLYLSQATLLSAPTVVEGWRRWSYAGYYVDERFTRLVLLWWPNRWMPKVRVRPYVALGPTQEQS